MTWEVIVPDNLFQLVANVFCVLPILSLAEAGFVRYYINFFLLLNKLDALVRIIMQN